MALHCAGYVLMTRPQHPMCNGLIQSVRFHGITCVSNPNDWLWNQKCNWSENLMQPPHVYVCEWFRSLAIQLIFKFSVTKFSCKYWKFIFFQNWWWSRKLCHLIIKFTGFGCMIKWNTSCEIYIDNWQWLIIYQSCKILFFLNFRQVKQHLNISTLTHLCSIFYTFANWKLKFNE